LTKYAENKVATEKARMENARRSKSGTGKRGTKSTLLENEIMSTMESQNAPIYLKAAYVYECSLSAS